MNFVSFVQAQALTDPKNDSQFIVEQKANETNIIASYKNEIAPLAATAQKSIQAPDIQNYIYQLKTNSQVLFDPASALLSTNSTGRILVFASTSMPKKSLQQWFDQAQKIHAALILRGFINNSLPDTKEWVKQLMAQNNNKGGIQINPVAFENYAIQEVPAVVVISNTFQCPSNMSCMTPPFDAVYGNVSLAHALKVIADNGDAANAVAQTALNQLRTIRD